MIESHTRAFRNSDQASAQDRPYRSRPPRRLRSHAETGCHHQATAVHPGHDCQHSFRELGHISREAQDAWALKSHQRAVAGRNSGFFDDLIIKLPELERDSNPRADTSAEKLAAFKPAFDMTSGERTLTAENSSPITDGAIGCWIANEAGITRLPANTPYLRLVDYEITAVDHHTEGLLMAPSYAIPRLLARHGLRFDDIDLWEIHLMCAGLRPGAGRIHRALFALPGPTS